MTELTEDQKAEIIKHLNKMEHDVNEARKVITDPAKIELLDEVDKFLDKMRVKKE